MRCVARIQFPYPLVEDAQTYLGVPEVRCEIVGSLAELKGQYLVHCWSAPPYVVTRVLGVGLRQFAVSSALEQGNVKVAKGLAQMSISNTNNYTYNLLKKLSAVPCRRCDSKYMGFRVSIRGFLMRQARPSWWGCAVAGVVVHVSFIDKAQARQPFHDPLIQWSIATEYT